jgi:hypothetical protein
LGVAALGFWDVGPFDNDDAADFAGDLDAVTADARIEMVGRVLDRVATANDDVDMWHIPKAVAAAALIAGNAREVGRPHPGYCVAEDRLARRP